jgi:nucleoside-diphosphate-sugar epimerase
MRIVVTGAGGFIGSGLVGRLAAAGGLPGGDAASIVAADLRLADDLAANVVRAEGDVSDADFLDALLAEPADVVFHLAGIPGGATEADPALGWRVNALGAIGLVERLARQARPARLVFSSSIAVFGVPLPADAVTDETLPLPTLSYGAQKLMIETLVTDHARRGTIDALSLRLPGIVARPRRPGGHHSAYMSDIFTALAAGESYTCPVGPDSTSWLMSRACCVDNLVHAATLPRGRLGARRAFTLPALRLSMGEVVEAIAARFGPQVRDNVVFEANAALQAQYGSYPPLKTTIAERLGFRHDGDAATLLARTLGLAG